MTFPLLTSGLAVRAWVLASAIAVSLASATARAEPAVEPSGVAEMADQPFALGQLVGGVLAGTPAALGTGLTMGPSLWAESKGWLRWGAELGWVMATEYTQSWTVTHDEVRIRLTGSAVRSIGRARAALQLGLGLTPLYEGRQRAQAGRIGSTGAVTADSAWAVLAGGDLRAAVSLPILSSWGVSVAFGPGIHVGTGDPAWGWTGCLMAGWLP